MSTSKLTEMKTSNNNPEQRRVRGSSTDRLYKINEMLKTNNRFLMQTNIKAGGSYPDLLSAIYRVEVLCSSFQRLKRPVFPIP